MHSSHRTANLLGAASLALSDRLLAGATAAAGTSASGAAALVILSREPALSITELSRRVGVSQPAATRMIENLEAQGLVRRERGMGRWVVARTTDLGDRAAHSLLTSRGDALREALAHLDQREQERLEELLLKLLAGLYAKPGDAERLCRLCDRDACVAHDCICPVGQADREYRAHAADA